MDSPLTPELIESAIAALPPQGRIMLRLLLLQYLDVTEEDIDYIAVDRLDPRMLAGAPTRLGHVTQDTLQSIRDRVAQYRTRLRQHRERLWIKTECLRRQLTITEAYCRVAEQLMLSRFGMDDKVVQQLKAHARSAVLKPLLREVDRKWEQDQITEEEYRKSRLPIEYQLLLRKLDREQRRLDMARREQEAANLLPLQDHEVAQVWGIPIGTLMARKVKYLHQYLQGVQAELSRVKQADPASMPPRDLWKETFVVLAQRPVPHSVATYDGLERTEAQLMETISALASATLSEEIEGRFWQAMTQEAKHAGEYGSTMQSLFALQRYYALLGEMESSPEAVEQELLTRSAPKPKPGAVVAQAEAKPAVLGDMGQHVLRSFTGEDHSDTRAKR
jgi:hypothetical protein